MAHSTFDQLFRFRTHCLCGSPLTTMFRYSSFDNDYISVTPRGSYDLSQNGSLIKFACNIDSRISPYGEAKFDIYAYMASPTIKLVAEYVNPHAEMMNTVMPAEKFVERHFDEDAQKGFNINLQRRCAVISFGPQPCSHHYILTTSAIQFDIKKKELLPITLLEETFDLLDDRQNRYRFTTNFAGELTSIIYTVPKGGYILGEQKIVDMKSEKFLKYPFEREFLLNKLKTLLLFS